MSEKVISRCDSMAVYHLVIFMLTTSAIDIVNKSAKIEVKGSEVSDED